MFTRARMCAFAKPWDTHDCLLLSGLIRCPFFVIYYNNRLWQSGSWTCDQCIIASNFLDGLEGILERRAWSPALLLHCSSIPEEELLLAQVWEGTSSCAACPQLRATPNLFTVPLQLRKRAHVLPFQRVGGWHAVVAQPWVTHPATCQGVQPSRTIVAFPLPTAPPWKQNANQRANFSAAIYSFARSDKQIFQRRRELDGAVVHSRDTTIIKLNPGCLKGIFGTIPFLVFYPRPVFLEAIYKGAVVKVQPRQNGTSNSASTTSYIIKQPWLDFTMCALFWLWHLCGLQKKIKKATKYVKMPVLTLDG